MLPNDTARCMGWRCDARFTCARYIAPTPWMPNVWQIDPDKQGTECAERIPVESDDD